MKHPLTITAAFVVVLLALPAAVGMLARPSFDTLVQRLEQGYGRIGTLAPQSTDAGWFQTRRRISVAVDHVGLRSWLGGMLDGADPAAPLILDADVAMRHGPLPFAAAGDGTLSPALADTRLEWRVRQGEVTAALPARLLMRSGPRRTRWQLAIDPHDYATAASPGTRVMHTGARIDGSVANDRSALDARVSLGDVALVLGDGRRIDVLGASWQFDMQAAQARSVLSVADVISTVPGSAAWRVSNVTATSTGEVAAQRVTTTTAINIGELRVAGETRGNSASTTVDFAADARTSAALVRFVLAMLSGSSVDDGPVLIGELATRGIRVAVPDFVFDTPEGMMQAQMEGELPAGDGDARAMLQRSTGTARLAIPLKLLRQIMASSPDLEASLQYALQSHLISRRGQQYVSNWRLRNGDLRINGRPVPLPL